MAEGKAPPAWGPSASRVPGGERAHTRAHCCRRRVFHTHAYLWWTDGLGLRRRNTDDLVFKGVRP